MGPFGASEMARTWPHNFDVDIPIRTSRESAQNLRSNIINIHMVVYFTKNNARKSRLRSDGGTGFEATRRTEQESLDISRIIAT